MNTIHFNPTKLDRLASEYFEMAKTLENSDHPHPKSEPERMTLAGIALRMWAEKVRRARARKRRDTIRAKQAFRATY